MSYEVNRYFPRPRGIDVTPLPTARRLDEAQSEALFVRIDVEQERPTKPG